VTVFDTFRTQIGASPVTGRVPAMAAPVPLDLVLGGRTITEPRLGPGGRLLADVVADADGVDLHVVDLDAGDGATPRPLGAAPAPAAGRTPGGGTFDWFPDGSSLVYAGVDGGLWRIGVDGSAATPLWPASGNGADPPATAPAVSPDGTSVAFTRDERDVYVVEVSGPDRTPRRLSGGADGDPAFAFDPVFSPDGTTVAFQGWSPPDMAWDGASRFTVPLDGGAPSAWRPDGGAVQQPGFAPDGTPVVVCDAGGWLNVWWGHRPLVADPFEHAGPTWGPRQRSWCVSPAGDRVAFTRNEAGFGRLCVVDVATGEVAELGRGVHAQLSWQGSRLAALRSGARTPSEVVVYELPQGERRRVTVGPDPAWGDVELAEPELVTVDHDGVTLHARRYRAGAGTPAPRLLVWVHGGPTSQWDVSFLPGAAFWTSRGWDVLVVDPRGSTGHGRAYQQALHGNWGALDVDDVAALTRHAHAEGWGTPATTAIMGGSSGGLVVLGALGHHGDLYAAGVAPYPVSDIADLSVHSHRFERHYNDTLIGPPDDPATAATAAARSPLSYAGRIATPLLLLHGTDDPVVPVAQSIELAGAIRNRGGHVELHRFDGQGHGFRGPAKAIEYRLVEEFLDRTVAG